MKKIMLLAVSLMALLAVSCQKEKEEELPIFTAHADNGGMKTDLVGNLIHWNNTDQVKVFGDFGYAVYSVSPRGDDPTWATLTPISNHGITGFLPYRFVYPASMAEGGSANNNTLYVNYPNERNINDAPLKYFPMYGESDHRDVAFHNLGGLIKIVLPEIDRQIVQIRITTDETNCGKHLIDSDGGLVYSGADATADKSVVVATGSRTFAQGDCVYVAMPAGQYHNFTIEIISANEVATKVGSVVNVQQSAITTITVSNLMFENPEWPAATLKERAFYNLDATSLTFHYNYTDGVTGAGRIDDNSNATPIYKKIIDNVCHVYTPAATINAPVNSSDLFAHSSLLQIDFGIGFNTSNVTNMAEMFLSCSELTSLDLSNFNTSNVTNMAKMFYNCCGLTSLDLSHFNTSNVTNMGEMFRECGNLTSLDLSNFNTSNVTNMGTMFYKCRNLTSLDISNFNTSNVTNMGYMFSECRNLTSLDISNFNTSNVTNMRSMFYECRNLTSLDLSNFNTSNVTNMGSMFSECRNLTSLDLSSFSSNSLIDFSSAFLYCTALQSIRFSNSFTLSSSCEVYFALCGVGSTRTTTIKCNSQTKNRLMNANPGSRVVWDLY